MIIQINRAKFEFQTYFNKKKQDFFQTKKSFNQNYLDLVKKSNFTKLRFISIHFFQFAKRASKSNEAIFSQEKTFKKH